VREGLGKIVSLDETIAAISTPFGRSGVGLVRISGSRTRQIAERFFDRADALKPRHAVLGHWSNEAGEVLDQTLCTFFAGPHSYTGEDLLEVSAHGNPFLLQSILSAVRAAGVRLASPGEFTLRAVAHGKMDLIQAEAVGDFIAAQTESQARQARQQLEGMLSRQLHPMKDRLIQLIAELEAGIDFAEDDTRPPDNAAVTERIGPVLTELSALEQSYGYGRIVAQGVQAVLVGRPNVGKSSLFNRLLDSERSIVSAVPGTTRDVVSEILNVQGVPLRLSDTAGWRQTTDIVEQIGVERTRESVLQAELLLVVLDGSAKLEAEDLEILDRTKELPRLVVLNKSDNGIAAMEVPAPSFRVSARTGEGMAGLIEGIGVFLLGGSGSVGESVLTTERQKEAVGRAILALEKGQRSSVEGAPQEMVLLDLYNALEALNELTGEVVTEDILGRIFSTFCIGK
jgi:tRNA modification GTPase